MKQEESFAPLGHGLLAAEHLHGRLLAEVAMRLLKLLLILFVCAAGPVVAGPFEDGLAAAQKGDYATALRLWRPLADQGDDTAQYNLGSMYFNGQGVPQDYVQAHKWWNLAAVDGNTDAITNREAIAAKMTPAQIAEAQKLAREWKPK